MASAAQSVTEDGIPWALVPVVILISGAPVARRSNASHAHLARIRIDCALVALMGIGVTAVSGTKRLSNPIVSH